MNKTIIFSLLTAFCSLLGAKEKTTWLAPDPITQIKREAKDDQLGHGRLFVPSLTYSSWEPEYKVYSSNGEVFSKLKTGESYFFKPGKYRLVLGSAVDNLDKIQKNIEIQEQQTTIIEPEWSGLVIKVIDENREGIRMGYEIFHQNSEISLGVKYSKADDEYDDRQATWLLPPGKYKLVKYGEPYNTLLNFSTFDLNAGELKKMTVVKDSKTSLIVGAGELPEEQFEFATAKDWRSYLFLMGQFSYNGNNDISKNDNTSILTFKGKIDNHVKYDKQPYYLSFRQTMETGFNKYNSENIIIGSDEFKLDNTLIYYFTKVIGVYTDLDLTTKFFPATIYFDTPKTILMENETAPAKSIVAEKQKDFDLSPSIYPLSLREEAGLNFSFIKTSEANLYIRTGFGFKQKQNSQVYTKISETDSTLTIQSTPNEYIQGFVLAGGIDWQLPGNITYNSEGNLLYSLNKKDDYEMWLNNTLNFKFFKYISLDYSLNLKYNSTTRYINYNNQMALEFSYYLNY